MLRTVRRPLDPLLGTLPVAKPNYSFEKRQKELAKKKKRDEKLAKKTARTTPAEGEGEPGAAPDATPPK
jgi:hypothetical protein